MKKTFSLVANWKMQLSVREQLELAKKCRDLGASRSVQITLCPSTESLYPVAAVLRGSRLTLGAQNCHHESHGAYTGGVSLQNLSALGCRSLLVGHSELRAAGEDDELIRQKLGLAAKITSRSIQSILCVGEQGQDRRKGYWKEILVTQLQKALRNQPKELFSKLSIAYEPVWAIGSGKFLEPKDWEVIARILREALKKCTTSYHDIPLLYGGSVDSVNASHFLSSGSQGLLIGRASQSFPSFKALVQSIEAHS